MTDGRGRPVNKNCHNFKVQAMLAQCSAAEEVYEEAADGSPVKAKVILSDKIKSNTFISDHF